MYNCSRSSGAKNTRDNKLQGITRIDTLGPGRWRCDGRMEVKGVPRGGGGGSEGGGIERKKKEEGGGSTK